MLKRVYISLPRQVQLELAAMAAANGISPGEMAERLLCEGVKQMEDAPPGSLKSFGKHEFCGIIPFEEGEEQGR